MFLWLISWVAVVLQLAFFLLSLAAGLYYLAELIEEYSVLAKKVIGFSVLCVVAMHVGLWVIDGFPLLLVLAAVLTHLCYGSLLSTFPVISLLSPGFIAGTVFLLVSHYLAFQYFATEWYPFQEVLAFFFCGLWMVPFAFFISLSANDLVLPTLSGQNPVMSIASHFSYLFPGYQRLQTLGTMCVSLYGSPVIWDHTNLSYIRPVLVSFTVESPAENRDGVVF